MAKIEKWDTALSIIAIVISIVSPIITFYTLNDYELKYKYRHQIPIATYPGFAGKVNLAKVILCL